MVAEIKTHPANFPDLGHLHPMLPSKKLPSPAITGLPTAVFRPGWEYLKDRSSRLTLDYDTQRAVFDIHPLDDIDFAGATGLEPPE